MSRGRDRYRGRVRPRTATGVYKRCRRGALGLRACSGYIVGRNGQPMPHGRCGGDGYIKVGTKGTGRKRRRVAGSVAGGAALWGVLGETLGTVGYILAAVVIVAVVALKVLALVLRGGAALAGASR